MPFPEILRELREKKGYTQEDLGKLLNLSKNAVSHYEKDISQPNIETLQKIADIFDVSVDYLIGRTSIHVSFSVLKTAFAKGLDIDDFLEQLLSTDIQHRADILKFMNYVKFHNDVIAQQKKSKK